jgi:pathogenesis-related protein 1
MGLALMFALGGVASCSGDDTTGPGTPGADPENNLLLNGVTKAHNNIRAGVMPAPSTPMPPLEWSDTIAQDAQTWANNCMFTHGGPGNYGQNIFASSRSASPIDVVADWASEGASYDYDSNSCNDFTCGHYTQIVWAKSTQLGCGVQTCTRNSPFGGGSWQLWVCNYDPPGNFNNEKPY